MGSDGAQKRSKRHIFVLPLVHFWLPINFSNSWKIILTVFLFIIINPRAIIKLIEESRNFVLVPDYNNFPILFDLHEFSAVTQDFSLFKGYIVDSKITTSLPLSGLHTLMSSFPASCHKTWSIYFWTLLIFSRKKEISRVKSKLVA